MESFVWFEETFIIQTNVGTYSTIQSHVLYVVFFSTVRYTTFFGLPLPTATQQPHADYLPSDQIQFIPTSNRPALHEDRI